MPDTTHIRSSHQVALPEDVTDPLLWRAAYDVAAAHRPDAAGRCASLLCAGRPAPCEPLTQARRAMRLAQGAVSRRPAGRPVPARSARDRRHAA
ncbi:hypothetical protein [Micromonospora auratinigra]|uniref:Uncharacterized protein n=1 Tax=Micromonospora auratinigra TaxID=261654 RepID=A0A1A8ZFU3_9ACTN|nr:hypothetical protein [Micromonospora auratinigra]SBT42679.1 hypothetical protein GA0070611_2058 [Micromonospora auratinigra]